MFSISSLLPSQALLLQRTKNTTVTNHTEVFPSTPNISCQSQFHSQRCSPHLPPFPVPRLFPGDFGSCQHISSFSHLTQSALCPFSSRLLPHSCLTHCSTNFCHCLLRPFVRYPHCEYGKCLIKIGGSPAPTPGLCVLMFNMYLLSESGSVGF